jgi:hypothetical protein
LLQFFNGATPEAEPMMAAKTMAADEGARSMAMTAPAPAAVPWYMSSVIDYFLLGALFVLLVILVTESINYWRNRRG